MSDDFALSREDLLAGRVRFDRRPARVLGALEARCAYLLRESRRAVEAYFLQEDGQFAREFDLNFFQAFRLQTELAERLRLADLERYACHWQRLVPPDPGLRADVTHLLLDKYPAEGRFGPGMWTALGLDDPAVQAAYRTTYGQAWPVSLAAGGEAGEEPAASEPTTRRRRDQEAALREAALREAESAVAWVDLPSGAVLYRAGDPGDALYILVSGRLRAVVHEENGSERVVAELGRGELVGEAEALGGDARLTTVYAVRDSEVARLSQTALERLAEKYPQVMLRVNRGLAERLRAQWLRPARVANTLVTFAVMPAGRGVAITDFCQRLAGALATFGPVRHLDRAAVDQALGAGSADTALDDPATSRVAGWLSEQEVEHRFVIYQADTRASAWTDRCLRQADRILILASAGANPRVGDAERRIVDLGVQGRAELALLHPDETARPQGTSRWLAGRQILRHHHLHAGSTADLARLARHLTGHAVGLVLGGGGARGWAHVGAWRALRESGLPVDLIGGTSMGGLVGAMFAQGLDEREVRQIARHFSALHRWLDLTLPVVSLLASGKATEAAQTVFGDLQIEDLWQPFFCVASDLTRAEPLVFTTGPLWQAVRASTSIPAIFAPVLFDNRVLVDGAVLNNLPIDIMRDHVEGGTIVAVNVFPDVDLQHKYSFDTSVSGFEALLSWVNPFAESMPVPNIFESLVRVMALNDVQQAKAKRALADIYIRPPVERYRMLDFGAYPEIIEIGYQAACAEIARWRRSQTGASVAHAEPLQQLGQALARLEQWLADSGVK